MLPKNVIKRALLRALGNCSEACDQIKELTRFSLHDPDWHVTIIVRPRKHLPPGHVQTPGRHADNGQTHKKIPATIRAAIEELAGQEILTGKEIATKLKHAYSGSFREYLATMEADGTIVHTAEGYTLADPEP